MQYTVYFKSRLIKIANRLDIARDFIEVYKFMGDTYRVDSNL